MRTFDGVDDEIEFTVPSVLATSPGTSAWSIAAILRRVTFNSYDAIVSLQDADTSVLLNLGFRNTDELFCDIAGGLNATSTFTVADNALRLVGAAAEDVATNLDIDFYAWNYATAAESTDTNADTADQVSTNATKLAIGTWENTDNFNGDILAVAIWLRELTTDEFRQLRFNLNWAWSNPAWWVILNQAATSMNVPDLSGNGGNQSAITGTAVASTSVIGVGYGAPLIYVTKGGGGGAQTISKSGSITPVGALVKKIRKTLAGALTPAGTLRRKVAKPLAGSLTPSGALTLRRVYTRTLTGSITPTGAVTKKTSKAPAGTLTPTGALAKKTSKTLAGSLAPSGALTQTLVRVRTFTGSITPAGSLTRKTGKLLSGSLTPAGALVKKTAKLLAGSITPTGALTFGGQTISKSGSITPTGTVRFKVSKALAGSVTPAGTCVKKTGKRYAGSCTPTGALTRTTLRQRTFTGSITPTGAVRRSIDKYLFGQVTPAGALSRVGGTPAGPELTPKGATNGLVLTPKGETIHL